MIVVSDASPLHYLILIGSESVLNALFGDVFTPPAVIAELQHPKAPERVRTWLAAPPKWLRIQSPRSLDASLPLDRGEAEAIALAEELKATTVLIDEHAGRRIARARGLRVTGTLGVLELGAERGLVSLPDAVRALQATDYRIADRIIADALQRDAIRRHGAPPRNPP